MTINETLQHIISKYGRSILTDHKRVQALLFDLCPEENQRRDINLAIVALKEGVPRDLIAMNAPVEIVIGRLVKRLEDQHYYTEQIAKLAIGVWVDALKITLPELEGSSKPPQNPKITKTPSLATLAPSMPTTLSATNLKNPALLFYQNKDTDLYNQALLFYQNKDYAQALNSFKLAADLGNSQARFWIGVMYDLGSGVTQDKDEAANWYRKSADQGNTAAQIALNSHTAKVSSIINPASTVVPAQSIPAPITPNATDLYNQAFWFYKNKNYAQAFVGFRDAGNQGNAQAQYWMGVMYDEGNGIAQNTKEAVKWYRKSADQGDKAAQIALNKHSAKVLSIVKPASNTVPARPPTKVADLFTQALLSYQNKDFAQAFVGFRNAANQYNPQANFWLGVMYEEGNGIAQNKVEAVKCYRKAADNGDPVAQFRLGVMYEKGYGYGVIQNKDEARIWYRKAADQGYTAAQTKKVDSGWLRKLKDMFLKFLYNWLRV